MQLWQQKRFFHQERLQSLSVTIKTSRFSKDFLKDFLTLDAIGALVLSTIVVNAIRQNGIQEKKSIAKYTIICGSIAALFLTIVYFLLGYIGASNGNLGQFENGGQLLATVMYQFFGTSGNVFIKYRHYLRLFNNSNWCCKCIRQLFRNSINKCFLQKSSYYTFVSLVSLFQT